MFISKGFTDYLSKPVAGKDLERMLQKYLPQDKIISVDDEPEEIAEVVEEKISEPVEVAEEKVTEPAEVENIDVKLGMGYCGDMEELFKEFVQMFCERQAEVTEKLQNAFDTENWKDYTTHIHALKSSSLSVGGKILSEQAKALEMAGHAYLNNNDESQIDYIRENHEKALKLYDAYVAEAKNKGLTD